MKIINRTSLEPIRDKLAQDWTKLFVQLNPLINWNCGTDNEKISSIKLK